MPVAIEGEFSPATQLDTICFNLTVTDDSVVEETELVIVSVSSTDLAVTIPEDASQLNITIRDDDSKIAGHHVQWPAGTIKI